ncbi:MULTISPECIES: lipocalin family protein [Microbulbifer]|uniref:lipocalin family protein n=1 Tax=Microbulbifer TaxID=48073 RepID=UPI001CD7B6B0|nr:lipocalin family protein [Microbulbifer agarilyticus]MCA0900121.1 lipocalin family protein [Microbulbifer agarilyticus]
MKNFLTRLVIAASVFLTSCTGIPEGVTPVENFTLDPYLGRWYEIARLDHSFERGLTRVTAEYSMRENGGVRVVNRGFDAEKSKWQQVEGKAYFVGAPNVGHLKVSFFGPFYGSYIIFDLDQDYRYAMVAGPSRSYLWLLSRTPTVDEAVKQRFINRAESLGFDTRSLIFVEQAP